MEYMLVPKTAKNGLFRFLNSEGLVIAKQNMDTSLKLKTVPKFQKRNKKSFT